MPKLTVHVDCDPGSDDAIALLFGFGAGLNIQSVSVVGGNADVEKCARNALQILELAGKENVPVYKGAALPLKRAGHPLPQVFGESGMDGADLPDPKTVIQAADALSCLCAPNLPATVVALGPLTNLAMALQRDTQLANRIDHLILMGGCTKPDPVSQRMGNIKMKGTDGYAEYNFAIDPEAAKIVMQSGIKRISLIGLDITRSVLYNGALDKQLRACTNRSATVTANILGWLGDEDKVDYKELQTYPNEPIRAMHDVVAMAYCTNPEIFTVQTYPLEVVVGDAPLVSGQTLLDTDTPDRMACDVITDLDRPKFYALLRDYIERLP